MNASPSPQTPSPQNPGLLNWLLIVGLGVVWGSAFMSKAIALEGFGPAWVAAGYLGLGALILIALAAARGQKLSAIWRIGGLRGVLFVGLIGLVAMAMPQLALAWGQQHVPSAFAGVAMGAVPLLVLPLVHIFSPEEGLGLRQVVGFMLGFIGLLALIGPSAFDAGQNDLRVAGQLACILAACGYAVGSVMTRRAPKMPPLALAAGTLSVAALLTLPYAALTEPWPEAPGAGPVLALLYQGLMPAALGTFIRVRVITTAGSLFMSMTSYMVPVWAVIFGIALMNEALPAQLFIALGLILSGIFIAQSRQILAAFRGA